MTRVLLAGVKQETATVSPVPTRLDDFEVARSDELAGTATEAAGALEEFAREGVAVVPGTMAWALSGGRVEGAAWRELLGRIVADVERAAGDVDAVLLVLHGAMVADGEDDPDGLLLAEVRRVIGDRPLVASLDLHAVLTDRMLAAADALVPFHTYPHTDHAATGARAAGVVTRLAAGAAPVTARARLPLLARGDELLTATGLLGEAVRRCQELEAGPDGLAAGVLIGNPFTDVPDLASNVLVTLDGRSGDQEAEAIAAFLWEHRHRLVAELTPLDDAVRIATESGGLTVFSDGADATSSGAPGDSNAVLRALLEHGYPKRALLSIVDAPAAKAAARAGAGAELRVALGGTLDPARHTPLQVTARVLRVSGGDFTYEDGTAGRAGTTAVLLVGGAVHVVVTERAVWVVGRRVYEAQGTDPRDFDLVVLKSPNGFRASYEPIAARILAVDAPGATTANLRRLPYTRAVRPLFPLD